MMKADPREALCWEPASQRRVFRRLMRAFSFPGQIERITCGPDADPFLVLRMILATLTDGEVSIADPGCLVDEVCWRRLGAKRMAPEKAHFVVAPAEIAPGFTPCLGTLEAPERGATLILMLKRLGQGRVLDLSGPGIETVRELACDGLDEGWIRMRREWNSSFPLGVDMILFDAVSVAALPRTTKIQ